MKKNCVNCFYADFQKSPSGSRNLKNGICNFELKMPHSFLDLRGYPPYRRMVSKFTEENCPCWVSIKKGGEF